MPNNGSPLIGSNLSCIRQINLMMQSAFAEVICIEDLYGLHIGEIDGELCLRLDKSKGTTYLSMFDMFYAWQEQAEKLKSGEITKEEYDQWRYNYPKKTT